MNNYKELVLLFKEYINNNKIIDEEFILNAINIVKSEDNTQDIVKNI